MLKPILEAVGQTYRNFLITKYLPLKELDSTLIELIHVPSGARVMQIANADPENLFCLSFQTLPSSSNGVAHILEHTVLCGSKKFPVKDPFFAMIRRSLNTYMNALTGQDFTCYPASSQVEKDFYNLLEVYLDAVFRPQLKKLSFLQEGHRLSFNGDALEIQGIVYNEMKGAMSSIESRLWESLSKRLIPDLPYAHNSGGNPKEIPRLSYEELCEFHESFYHPSRCLFFFYGNLPLSKHLDVLEEELQHVRKEPLLPPLPLQKRFTEPVFAEDFFPIAEGEEQQTQIAFAWLTAPISQQKEILALEVLESILTDTDASPLTKALLKSGLCTQVDSMMDGEMSEVPWIITCKGTDAKHADALQKTLFETLKKIRFKPDEIEAALHQLEFERTEIGGGSEPFGLTLFMRSALLKQHGSEPENALLIHTLFSELREQLKNPHYLPNLLKKYLLENPHFVRLTLKPDPNLAKKELEEEKASIAKIAASLTPEKKRAIHEQTAALKAYQEEVEHQSLDCLPKVTLRDVPPHARDFPLFKEGSVFHHNCFTNQILYADLVFDLPELAAEELPLLSLFAHMLPELGCGGRDYEENLAYQQRYTGGFDASLALHVTHENPDLCKPTFTIRGKALYRNEAKLFSLFADVRERLDFNKGRIREWLSQHATEQKELFPRASLSFATQTALMGLSLPSFLHEKWYGMSYYQAVLQWEKSKESALIQQLETLADKILKNSYFEWVVGCDGAHFAELKSKNYFFRPSLLRTPWKGAYPLPAPQSQVHFIAAPVAFTAWGMRTASYNNPLAPRLWIATALMKNLVLHREIREKGGAYGGGASYAPSTGNFHFYAYRDPHLKASFDAFHKAIEHIGHQKFNERELEEAKLSVLQTLDAPVAPGHRALVAYSWARAGRTLALREEFRKNLLHTSAQEVADAVLEALSHQSGTLVSFLGKELFAKEEKGLPMKLSVNLSN